MRLPKFIEINKADILVEWDSFARKLIKADHRNAAFGVRDHAVEILNELIADMSERQSAQQQADKSQNVVFTRTFPESAADLHGLLRHHDGLNVSEVVSEFRALRASVLHLWLPVLSIMTDDVIDDVIRFNEAIDQAIADSIISYNNQ